MLQIEMLTVREVKLIALGHGGYQVTADLFKSKVADFNCYF